MQDSKMTTLEEFLEEDWVVSGVSGDGTQIELQSKDGQKFQWVSVNGLITIALKMHYQYMDEDVNMIFDK